MGNKICLLVYEWPLIKCKIWYMNGSIFQTLSQNWLKFKNILEKIGNFVQNLAQNWADWYMNGLLFLEKLVFVWVYFQIPWRHIPTKTKLEYPPGLQYHLTCCLVPLYRKAYELMDKGDIFLSSLSVAGLTGGPVLFLTIKIWYHVWCWNW